MPTDINGEDFKKFKGERKILIETGSEKGGGIQSALNAGFESIYSVEIDPKFNNECKERFKDNTNVNLYLGDSIQVLPEILNSINSDFILWLDAHWSGSEYMGEQMHDFLPKELLLLRDYKEKLKNSVIMIDDMNFYRSNASFCSHVENLLKEIKPSGIIEYYEALSGATILVCK